MSFYPPSLPAAGWYPDPHRPGSQRWWNGRDWDEVWSGPTPDDLPDIGEWLNGSFSNGFARWRAVATVAVVTGLPGSLVLGIATRRLVDGVVITDDGVTGWSNGRLPLAIVLLAISGLLSAVAVIAVTALMLRTVDGETAGETGDEIRAGGTALLGAFAVLPRAIGWILVFALGMLIVAAVIAGLIIVVLPLGVLVAIGLIPVVVYYGIGLAFLAQSIVDRPGQPFGRSVAVSRGRWWRVFGRVLLIGILTSLMSAVIQGVSAAAGGSGFGAGADFEVDGNGNFTSIDLADTFATTTWAIVLGAVLSVVVTVCITSVSSAAFARLYRTRNPVD